MYSSTILDLPLEGSGFSASRSDKTNKTSCIRRESMSVFQPAAQSLYQQSDPNSYSSTVVPNDTGSTVASVFNESF
jgi:hypothetical protein